MAKDLIERSTMTAIGNALRTRKGVTSRYKPSDMPAAITSIPEGYPEPTGTVNITQNGPQNVKDYASASVNVPNTYASGDEGKVVSGGALVAQTARAAEITQNGTYDTTLNDEVTVNVSGGGGIPTLTQAQWDELTAAQKQAYGLVGIITSATGFKRGDLVNGADYVEPGQYLPYSNKSNVICEATVGNFDATSTRWGLGASPVAMTALATISDGAVYIPVKSSGIFASVDLGQTNAPFTAYVVMKGSGMGQYSRLLSCFQSRSTGAGIMLYGSPVKVSSWASDTTNNKNYGATDYFVGVIQFSAPGSSLGLVNDSNIITKGSTNSGRYVVLGRTDIDSSPTNAEPTDIFVKYVGVVAEAESQQTITDNVSYLMDQFGITPNA